MMDVTLNQQAAISLWNCLSSGEPKGRSEVRLHAKAFRALKAVGSKDNNIVACVLTGVEDSVLDFIRAEVKARMDKGVNGQLSEGYSDLLDALEVKEPPK